MSPSAIEAHQRHERFHAEIARRASLVQPKIDWSYSIPNAPFGMPKPQPKRIMMLPSEFYWQNMWFYQLVFAPVEKRERILSVSTIQRVTAEYFGLTAAELMAERRTAKIVRARQIAVYIAKKLTMKSLPDIGRRFGGRDHTTILHAVNKMERLEKTDAKLAADIFAIRTRVIA